MGKTVQKNVMEKENSHHQRRQIYLNHGEEEEMEIIGYRRNIVKFVFIWICIILSVGFLALIFFWRRDWELKCMCDKSAIEDATHVLLEDRYKQSFVHRIHTRKAPEQSASVKYEQKNDSMDDDPFDGGEASQTLFHHRKLKYIFHADKQIFEKISIPPMKCSYLLQSTGLKDEDQEIRRWRYGENAIQAHMTPVIILLITQGLNPFYVFQLFSILLWTTAESYYYYAGCIGFLTLISLTAQIVQHRMMERALKNTISFNRTCHVYNCNENVFKEVSSNSLVPGDVIQIPEYDFIVPCDAVLISGNCIMDESMLTGESIPVTKTPVANSLGDPCFDLKENSRNILFSGTTVIQTRSSDGEPVRAVVYRTGFYTAKGELVRSIMFPKPLDFKFTKDSYKYIGVLAGIALGGMIYTCISLVTTGDYTSDIVMRMLDIITIAVPPALPAAMTCGIVFAQSRLRKSRIYCISPNTINVAGCIDTFCFDKTGTLTENGLDLLAIRPVEGKCFGEDYSATNGNGNVNDKIIATMATCHSLAMIRDTLNGDPLDMKMFEFTGWSLHEAKDLPSNPLGAMTIVRPAERGTHNYHKSNSSESDVGIIKQFTFNSKLQRMSVITRQNDSNGDNFVVCAKGSPEMITSLSRSESVPEGFEDILNSYTSQGYRVIALATKVLHSHVQKDALPQILRTVNETTREEVECDLTFLGLLVMENRLKTETTSVIVQLKKCNIRTVMVTGDNMLTALNVARGCKMLDENKRVILVCVKSDENNNIIWSRVPYGEMTTHDNFETDDEKRINVDENDDYHFAITGKSWSLLRQHHPKLLPSLVIRGAVFARFSPDQKKQLIEELQAVHYYVGMCGDGANDCGALKTAHAGISLSDAEASVASPFTSKDPNITCVPTLIREGRAALVTSFGIFKFMAGYSMTQFLICCVITWPIILSYMTNFEFLYEDLFLLTTLVFTFCFTKAHPLLSDKPPMVSLVSLAPIMSLLSIMFWNLGVMIFSYYATQAQPWYESPDARDGDDTTNQDTTMIFLITCSHFITMGIIFAKGAPYRSSIFSNYFFLANLIVCIACTTEMIFYPADFWISLLQMRVSPSYAYRAIIFGISIMHFLVCYLTEFYFIDVFIEQVVQPKLSKLIFGETLQYKLIEEELHSRPEWPPESDEPIKEVMEMELAVNQMPTETKVDVLINSAETIHLNGIVNRAYDVFDDDDGDDNDFVPTIPSASNLSERILLNHDDDKGDDDDDDDDEAYKENETSRL